MGKRYEMDMTTGALLPKIIRFALPLMLTGMLQLAYNAADVAVVGRFAGANALAAVSSTGPLIQLIVKLVMGLSLGASVLVGKAFGANNHKELSETVHTSIFCALVCSVAVGLVGIVFGRPLLQMMDTPADVLPLSTLYVTIYFSGSLFNLLFNFGAAILRAVGDTQRPMYYLILSGAVNVVLNLLFVIGLDLSVAGVALATVLSQALSAVLVMRCLVKANSAIRLDVRKIRPNFKRIVQIFRIGFPASVQGIVFSLSNVIIQSTLNSLGAAAMAGSGAATSLEGFVHEVYMAIYTTALTFTSQNTGARKPERIGRILWICLGCVMASGVVLCGLVLLFAQPLLSFYTTDPEVLAYGLQKLACILPFYFLCGTMDVLLGSLRGMGNSFVPMIMSILGVCGVRLVWVLAVFPLNPTLPMLYVSYPLSWAFTSLCHLVCFVFVRKKLTRQIQAESSAAVL